MRRRLASLSERGWSLALIAPAVALVVAFVFVPVARMAYYSLTRYSGLGAPEFVGLDNFQFLLDDPDFVRIVLNTALLACGLAVWVTLPLLAAIALFRARGGGAARTFLFLPVLLPPVIVGAIFRLVLADDGPLNAALRTVGLRFIAGEWLTNDRLVLISVVGVIAWATLGVGVILYTAGLAAIPNDHVEAALLDGARWRHLAWYIYRPALRPVTRFWVLLLLVATVSSFFPWIFGLTRGGPGIASTTLDYEVYSSGIEQGNWGIASAYAICSMLVLAALLLARAAIERLRGSR